ncbi:MAG TPA: hypothetical protein VGL72_04790 [Bryobacteraceae bacterium]|jgi:hypothetical protein
MLKIRQDQMHVFESEMISQLAITLEQHIKEHYPEIAATLSDYDLQIRVLAAIHQARRFGLANIRTIGDFVGRTFTIGPAFFEQKNIAAALAQVAVDPHPDTRFALLDLAITAEDLEEARTLSPSTPLLPPNAREQAR